ncbi:hypothetical protein V8E36_004730 [Tilletia maclaganii]
MSSQQEDIDGSPYSIYGEVNPGDSRGSPDRSRQAPRRPEASFYQAPQYGSQGQQYQGRTHGQQHYGNHRQTPSQSSHAQYSYEGVPSGPSAGPSNQNYASRGGHRPTNSGPSISLASRLNDPALQQRNGPLLHRGPAQGSGGGPATPHFKDAAAGADLLLPPVGKIWHPNSGTLNGRRKAVNSREARISSAEELRAMRLLGLNKLRRMFEAEFCAEWTANERALDDGFNAEWNAAVNRACGDPKHVLDLQLLKERAVGTQIRRFWETNRSQAYQDQTRLQVCARINRHLSSAWRGPAITVVPFGSTATGMALKHSDLDLCILDPERAQFPASTSADMCHSYLAESHDDLPAYYRVRAVSRVLERSGDYQGLVPIVGAKVPIVKYVDRQTKITGDININNRFGVVNSTMISAYCDIRPNLVRPLITFVKQCFNSWGLNDPSGSKGPASFNSYTLALLVITYLQNSGILPNLQNVALLKAYGIQPNFLFHAGAEGGRKGPRTIIPATTAYDTTFLDWRGETVEGTEGRRQAFRKLRTVCHQTGIELATEPLTQADQDADLGHCLMGFFRTFLETDWDGDFICFAKGTEFSRSLKQPFLTHGGAEAAYEHRRWYDRFPRRLDNGEPVVQTLHPDFVPPEEWEKHSFIVQDPFIVTRNTAGNIKDATASLILGRVSTVVALLERGEADAEVATLRGALPRNSGASSTSPASSSSQRRASRQPTADGRLRLDKWPDMVVPNLAEICRVPRYGECVAELRELEAQRDAPISSSPPQALSQLSSQTQVPQHQAQPSRPAHGQTHQPRRTTTPPPSQQQQQPSGQSSSSSSSQAAVTQQQKHNVEMFSMGAKDLPPLSSPTKKKRGPRGKGPYRAGDS